MHFTMCKSLAHPTSSALFSHRQAFHVAHILVLSFGVLRMLDNCSTRMQPVIANIVDFQKGMHILLHWTCIGLNAGEILASSARTCSTSSWLTFRYIIFNFFAIFFLFYLTRISKRERKRSAKKSPFATAKEVALNVGCKWEDLFIRKNDAENDKQGLDSSMNSASFAIFQGVGLETFDSRGLGRTWSRRDESMDWQCDLISGINYSWFILAFLELY